MTEAGVATATVGALRVRVWDFLLSEFPDLWPSRRQAKRACELGRVKINGEVNHSPALILVKDDFIELTLLEDKDPPVVASDSELAKRGILLLHRDDVSNILVALKPAGLKLRGDNAVVGAFAKDSGKNDTLESLIQRSVQLPLVVAPGHALPKAASGLVLMHLPSNSINSSLIQDTYVDTVESVDIDDANGCPWCASGICITTLAVLCGECPEYAWVSAPKTVVKLPEAVSLKSEEEQMGAWDMKNRRKEQEERWIQQHSPDMQDEEKDWHNKILLLRLSVTPSNRHGSLSTVELHTRAVAKSETLQIAMQNLGYPVANDPHLGRKASVSRVRGMLFCRIKLGIGKGIENQFFIKEPLPFQKLRIAEKRFCDIRKKTITARSGQTSFDGAEYDAPIGIVMQPRDATTLLVDIAYKIALEYHILSDKPLHILDLGTGSGCVLLALLKRLATAGITCGILGVGIDTDEDALKVAMQNEEKHRDQLGDNIVVSWCKGTFLEFGKVPLSMLLSTDYAGKQTYESVQNMTKEAIINGFDIIISNPPYLDENNDVIDDNIRLRDPHSALFCGNGGLQCYNEIASNSNLLCNNRNARLILEIPGNKAKRVLKAVYSTNDCWCEDALIVRDIRGQERVLVLTKTKKED